MVEQGEVIARTLEAAVESVLVIDHSRKEVAMLAERLNVTIDDDVVARPDLGASSPYPYGYARIFTPFYSIYGLDPYTLRDVNSGIQ